ncbi:putative 2'-5' RNA ligase [Methylococcus capsulatus str. Bath]|uniref:RNA 2',3'-cyclic phosphodiesterase n=1 Tax=Methylococcus capsulatus (strain ATCC 33009 / NCIMB 11132 / Bath) TaxID=243233 RepID=Q60BS9_METCA|nr:RNA 2',3'-cyclic phosphodiesterase [Methylococcus capsulatus]AAU90486.1 putative 2'-5' RNA ligase [Methylococcus capsulatus str. Bath]
MSALLPEPPPLRLFFALWPDAGVRETLGRLVRSLRRTVKGRWVEPDKLHLTLAFLGAVPAERLPELTAMTGDLDLPPFELALDRLEYWQRNRVLCLGASATPPLLIELVGILNSKLGRAGFPVERRPFRPHLTLARKAEAAWSAMPLKTSVTWPVDRVTLVESRLSRAGPLYLVRAEKQWRAMPEMAAMK